MATAHFLNAASELLSFELRFEIQKFVLIFDGETAAWHGFTMPNASLNLTCVELNVALGMRSEIHRSLEETTCL